MPPTDTALPPIRTAKTLARPIVEPNNVPSMLTSDKPESTSQLTLDFETKAAAPDWRAQVPTVSQLTRRIRGHLENSFFDVWVKGEISNFRKPASGHSYFCLKDATSMMKAVMFRPSLAKIKFQIADGMEVLLHGKVTVYEARGEYQMVCDTMEPVGVGALQLAFEQLKQKLAKEGLFDPAHKKKLPHLPKRIAVVTSSTGAAVRDILKVLARRFPNLHILVIPAAVQGEKAAGEICQAISLAERWNVLNADRPIEAMIVGRGGGSLEDMWCFNEEVVARAIYQCSIPVISAVGHEIDFTIADFVADVRAPTPSAAAEIIVPNKADIAFQVKSHTQRLRMHTLKRFEQTRLHLGHLASRLVDPRQRVKDTRDKFTLMTQKLGIAMSTRLLFARKRWEKSVELLNTLSPLQVITRGYTITADCDGKIFRSAKSIKPGTCLFTQFPDGTVESQVKG